jgi:ankyrin repeat protein
MKDHKQAEVNVESQIRIFMSSACAGSVDAIRSQVVRGFDLNGTNQFGDTILEYAISVLEFYPQVPKYAVVQEMLQLGANPNAPSQDGSSPLFAAVLNLDTEMLRLLLDAGADPNVVRIRADGAIESLYDCAHSAYIDEVWKSHLPEGVTPAERKDQDAWLRRLAHLAVKYGKQRPDPLHLLRERGALSMSELRSRTQAKPRSRTAQVSPARRGT